METFRERERRDKRAYLLEVMQAAGGVVSKAARLAGVNRTQFYRMLDEHGVTWGKKRRPGNAAWNGRPGMVWREMH